MKFFIPFVTEEHQLERLNQRIVDHLTSQGYEPLKDQVYQVEYEQAGNIISEAVGRVSATSQEVVMAIYKNDRGYLICTYSRGASWGQPIIAHYKKVKSVTYFGGDEAKQR